MAFSHSLAPAIIQGISEAFPISSSSHLVFWRHWVQDVSQPWGPQTELFLHLGSFLALMVICRQNIARILLGLRDLAVGRLRTVHASWVWAMTLSTLPCVVVGGVLHILGFSFTQHTPPWAIAGITAGFGIVMYSADRWGQTVRQPWHPDRPPRWQDALMFGCAQVCAFVPGVSRLGIVMTAGRLCGYDTWTSATYAFLMGLVSMGSGLILKAPSLMRVPLSEVLPSVAVTVLLNIPLMMVFLALMRRRLGLGFFALYRCFLAVLWWIVQE